MSVPVSIVIATRDRCSDVLVALESCLALTYEPLEILLYDDASTDGTVDEVASRYPQVRVHASSTRQGYLVWRNRGFQEAVGDIVISLDDDAYFTDVHTIDRIVELFDTYPEAGAFALPYIEPYNDAGSAQMPGYDVGTPLRSYTGCAHAVRREIALTLGGYPEFLVHQGEERHMCLRMLQRGASTLFGDTPPIVHTVSPRRDRERVDYYGYRNTLLFTGLLAPAPYVLPRLILDSAQLFKHRFRIRAIPTRVRAIAAGWAAIWSFRKYRDAVSRDTYAEFRRRPGHGPMATSTSYPPLSRNASQCLNS